MLSFDDSEVQQKPAAGGQSGADASGNGGSSGLGGEANGGAGASGDGGAAGSGGSAGAASGGASSGGASSGGTSSGGASSGGTSGAGTGGQSGSGGDAGTGGSAAGPNVPNCAVGSDDFEDGRLSPIWFQFGPSVQEAGGWLRIAPNGSNPEYSGVNTLVFADLRVCGATVEVPQVLTSVSSTSIYFVFDSVPAGNVIGIQWESGNLLVGAKETPTKLIYDPVQDRFWRIAASGGTSRFYTSPDGSSWLERGSIKTPPQHSTGYVELAAGTWQAQAADIGVALFDDFNR
jgi:hypothetical protein